MKLAFSALCDQGPVRADNQDRYLVSDFSAIVGGAPADAVQISAGPRGVLLAIADGMGGHKGGAQAAELALGTLAFTLAKTGRSGDALEKLVAAVEVANKAVLRKSEGNPALEGMGTTLTAAHLRGKSLLLAHVGDSRAYLFRGGELSPLTTDHNMLTKVLGVDPDEARRRLGGNVLVQCVGGRSAELIVEATRVALCRGDRVLLCSDGLHGVLEAHEIRRLLSNADLTLTCKYLVEAAYAGGTTDNVTALLAEAIDESLPAPRGVPVKVDRVAEVVYDQGAGRIRRRTAAV